MIQASFPAMGTVVEVVASDGDGVSATRELFASLERRFSRFLEDSELSRINTSSATQIEVSEPMARLLSAAARLRELTGGIVDPAVGKAVADWGYDRTFSLVDGLDTAPPSTGVAGWSIEGTTLRRSAGAALDLGGVAKGWAADAAVNSGRALVVSAGGDVRSALADARVDVVDPWGDSAFTVALGVGALATSSTTRRRWNVARGEAHHLIDPRSGAPATTPILSATASCATAVESEAAAKSVLIRGASGLAWADDQPWIRSSMAVWETGSVFATHGWEAA